MDSSSVLILSTRRVTDRDRSEEHLRADEDHECDKAVHASALSGEADAKVDAK
jgi:hypothetical protein